MSSKQISPLLRQWYKWKSLRLPWRKRFLVGLDLQGNTYWEFRDVRGDDKLAKWRRIVQYPRGATYDTVKVPPQWHQWLRYLRQHPPTIQEQHAEVQRQMKIKYLAAEADKRWEAKPKVMMDGLSAQQAVPVLESRAVTENQRGETESATDEAASSEEQLQTSGRQQAKQTGKEDPWKKHRQSRPGEEWQPQAWTPPSSR